jgi:hypothetical protein
MSDPTGVWDRLCAWVALMRDNEATIALGSGQMILSSLAHQTLPADIVTKVE